MTAVDEPLRLTEWTSCGGCAAKWGASLLTELVRDFDAVEIPELIVGLAPFDDAAVYRLNPDQALVSTTDFFPPLVDDPADFGAIAAANACSDVFAMGADVITAINIAAFPEHFPHDAMGEIFAAAAATVAQAGGVVAGGHTIRNPEPIFGLAVQGLVHPERIFRKSGARAGDVLVASKPLGTGLALASDDPEAASDAIAGMRRLNRSAAAQLRDLGDAVHAVTDVTGYGLAGHGWEMAERADVTVVVESEGLVAYRGVRDAILAGVLTGGDARNRDYLAGHFHSVADRVAEALCFDPQTSGGLLAAIDPEALETLLAADAGWWRVGRIEAGEPGVALR